MLMKLAGRIGQQTGPNCYLQLSGSIEEDRMDQILGRNRRTISQEMNDLCTEDMKPLEIKLIKNSLGMKRPSLGVMSYKVGQCEVQLSDAGAYNDHMRDIHGVDTELRGTINSNLYPDINRPSAPSHNPNDGGINSLLGILAPTLKSLDAKGGKYKGRSPKFKVMKIFEHLPASINSGYKRR